MDFILFRSGFRSAKQRFMADSEEYGKIVLLFVYLFCAASASTIGRTAADTLFLSHFSASKLSLMYLPQAGILLLAGIIYQRLCRIVRIDLLCTIITLSVFILSLGSRMVAGLGYHWVYAVMYVAYDVFNFLMIVCFWQFATSVMDQRKAKKLINWVGSGSIVGGIVSGFGLKLLVGPLGTMNLIYIYAGLQLLCFLLVRTIIARVADRRDTFAVAVPGTQGMPGNKPNTAAKPSPAQAASGGMFRNVPHLKYIAIIAATITLSLTFADYQFKVILRETLQDEALAGFMGSFYGFAGLLALVVQFFLTGRVISNYGVMTSLLILPVALMTGSLGVLFAPILALAVFVKGSDKVLGDTIYSSVSQLVMFPVPPNYRARAKSFLDGIVRNSAKGIAAISLIALSPILSIEHFSLIILGLLICCIAAALRIKKAYMQMLVSTLQTREAVLEDVEWNVLDASSLSVLSDALRSPDKLQALYALRFLQNLDGYDLTQHLSELLGHPAVEVRVEALKIIQMNVPPEWDRRLDSFVKSEQPQEQSQALLALAAYGHDAQQERITSFLEDHRVEAKVAAIVGLIKYYGVDGMFQAVGTIKQLIASREEMDRIAVASLFGQIGVSTFYKPIIPLLSDPSEQVRIRSLESAATLRAPELVQYIMPLLSHSSTRHLAIEALAGYEEKVIEPLLKPYLTSEEASLHIPKIFEQIGTQRAFDVLLQSYKLVSGDVRTSMLESMTRMHDNGRYATSSVVEKLISEEARVIEQLIESSAGLESVPELFEISDAVKQLRRTIARRVFGLLALLYDSKVIHAVHTNWADGDVRRQANAAEVIDQLLHGEIRSTISRLMAHTESPRAEKLTDQRVIENRLLALQLIDHGDAWLSTCLKAAINELPVKKEGALSRETDHARNEHLRINKLLEQVQLLRELTLFKGMSGKDLAKIAESLHEVSFMEGESIIREGEQGDSLYLIQQGTAGVIRNEMKIGHLEEGECFGEMSVLTSGLRTATVRAESYIQLWRLDSSELYEMMFNQNEIALEIMRLLSKRLRGAILRSIQDRTGAGHVNLAAEDTTDIKQLSQVPAQLAAAANQELDQGRQPFTDNEMILRRILVLQKISLFANFSPEDFVKLAKMVDEVRYEQGERICSLGENGDIMHGIIEGSVRVHRDSETIAVLEEGECFGEMAIIDNEPRSADCTAASTSVLLQLSREQVLTFCFGRIDVMKGMLRILAERLKGMQEKG